MQKNMQTLNSDQIKKIELYILKEFAAFCEKNNLKYYLGYGTLLGAVRHKGFIPWDDDIDVLMPRPDYDRFIQLTGYNPIKPNLETRMYRNTANPSIYPFAKVIDTTTLVYEKGKAKKNRTGLWIDIFPLDGFSQNDLESAKKTFEKYLKLRNWLDLAVTNVFCIRQNIVKKIIKLFFVPFVKLYGVKRFCTKIDNNAQTYSWDKYDYVADMIWGDSLNAYFQKTELEPAVELDFEEYKFKAPACYKEYLTNLYGEYMTPPPESDRIPHGFKAYLIKGENYHE